MPNHMQFVAFLKNFGNFHDYTLLEMNFSKKSGIFTGAGLVFLYALVFVCRYLDLFTNFISVWVFEAPPSLGPFHFSSSFPLNLVHAGTTPS